MENKRRAKGEGRESRRCWKRSTGSRRRGIRARGGLSRGSVCKEAAGKGVVCLWCACVVGETQRHADVHVQIMSLSLDLAILAFIFNFVGRSLHEILLASGKGCAGKFGNWC